MQEQQVYSVSDFCQTNGISRSLFYKLCREGKGPRMMRVGRRTLISYEANIEWRKSVEVLNKNAVNTAG
jgi:predicted DNA-binding transcriptional regulator AlpA